MIRHTVPGIFLSCARRTRYKRVIAAETTPQPSRIPTVLISPVNVVEKFDTKEIPIQNASGKLALPPQASKALSIRLILFDKSGLIQ